MHPDLKYLRYLAQDGTLPELVRDELRDAANEIERLRECLDRRNHMTVVNLEQAREERKPHMTGPARCLDCKHEWVAVAPVGTIWMECPKCSLIRGRFVNQVERDGDHWVCNCGNDLFYVTSDGAYCPNCGGWHD